jgi:phosphatidylglycerophosphate synthase
VYDAPVSATSSLGRTLVLLDVLLTLVVALAPGHRAPLAAGVSLGLYALAAGLAWRGRRSLGPHLGVANVVTLGRLAATAWLAGLVAAPRLAEAWSGAIIVVGTAIGLADLLDGRLARRLGQASAFGATCDGETDALLTLVLALIVWRTGAARAHVLAIGLMRYAMLAAQLAVPRLRRQVPSSPLARGIFAVQLAALLYSMAPFCPAHDAVLALALGLLLLSFARDLRYLARAPA